MDVAFVVVLSFLGAFVVVFCFFFDVVFGAGAFVVLLFVVMLGLTVVYRIQIFFCLFVLPPFCSDFDLPNQKKILFEEFLGLFH